MTDKTTFKTEEDIRKWANTSLLRKVDGQIIQVKKDDLYHFFLFRGGVFTLAMTSASPFREVEE